MQKSDRGYLMAHEFKARAKDLSLRSLPFIELITSHSLPFADSTSSETDMTFRNLCSEHNVRELLEKCQRASYKTGNLWSLLKAVQCLSTLLL